MKITLLFIFEERCYHRRIVRKTGTTMREQLRSRMLPKPLANGPQPLNRAAGRSALFMEYQSESNSLCGLWYCACLSLCYWAVGLADLTCACVCIVCVCIV